MGEPNISTVRTDHEFGGVSTDLKLALVENYLRAFTQALRPRFNDLWYIDAFAGTGERTVRRAAREADLVDLAVEEQLERRRGSARIAVDIEPRFDRLVFIDTNRRHVRALKEIRDTNPGRKIDVYRREANAGILDLISGHKFAGTRAVMFLDPYGMHVEWATLQAVQRTEAIDVWYLVSLEGL